MAMALTAHATQLAVCGVQESDVDMIRPYQHGALAPSTNSTPESSSPPSTRSILIADLPEPVGTSSVIVDPVSEAAYDVVAVSPLPARSLLAGSDSIRPSAVKPTKLAQACSIGRSARNLHEHLHTALDLPLTYASTVHSMSSSCGCMPVHVSNLVACSQDIRH